MQEDFDKAAAEAKELPSGTSNDDQLILYGLFKQANIGDCNTSESPLCQLVTDLHVTSMRASVDQWADCQKWPSFAET